MATLALNGCQEGTVAAQSYNNGNGTDTGIDLESGASYSITANGSWSAIGGGQWGPDGNGVDSAQYTQYNWILPGAPIGALVGRIGTSGVWFLVGSNNNINPTQSGRLYLIINAVNNPGTWGQGFSNQLNYNVCKTADAPNSGNTGGTDNNPPPVDVFDECAALRLTPANSGLSQDIIDAIVSKYFPLTTSNSGLSQDIIDSIKQSLIDKCNQIDALIAQGKLDQQTIANLQNGTSGTVQQLDLTNLVDAINNVQQSIDTTALNAQRQSELQSEQQTSATNDLATQLSQSVTNAIGDFADTLKTALANTTGIPAQIIEPVIEAVKILIDNELKSLTGIANAQLNFVNKPLFPAITQAAVTFNKAIDNQAMVLQNLLHGQYSTLDEFYNALNKAGTNTGLLKSLQDTITVVSVISMYIKARLISAETVLNQLTLSSDLPNLNDINTIVLAYFRGELSHDAFIQEIAKYGLNEERANQLLISRSVLVGLSDLKTALQRGLISEDQHDFILSQYGMAQGTISIIKSVYELLPSPTDITRMADKHIFATDIPQIFGQNSELDQGYLDDMALWGISNDNVRKLWASHWSLPGLQETFDMWHRGFISDTELDIFFKLTDILPFFRDKLKLLSHNLVTRVDIRRMYHVGVYSQAQVFDAYKRSGYSDKDAADLTTFTVENDRLSELPKATRLRNLTESLVVKAFKKQVISKQDAINRLMLVGYTTSDASLILDLETQTATLDKLPDKTEYYHDKARKRVLDDYAKGVFSRDEALQYLIEIGVPQTEAAQELYYAEIERIEQLKSLVINHIRQAYTKGQITKADATNLMLTYGFGMSEITLLFEELDIVKSLRNKELTLPQLTAIAKKGIITPEQFAVELGNLGYNDTHVSWLLQETFGG